ncbi:HPr family phosphocarrier protein [Cellulomonas triticagri]|uniref:Phosphocarrier protein HPr n=1 Tax=Cellulomonas triticagri TaxID=2483352 RepID=A0A3M2IZR4_9CELL|nr:HPr family phosphocarrier protein [Cellulomonas triticagri]RMI05150.1 HPr family phosphocarrier protein [Cellulomonas triticagri]
MLRRRARVATASGLHARPASLVTGAVAAGGHPVQIARVGQPAVDASSILMLMGMKLEHGEEVELTSESADAETLLDELAALLESDLDAVAQA